MAGTDCGVNFGAGLAVEIVKAVRRQARYCYQFHDLVKDMGDEQENLISTKDDMQSQLGNDSANNKYPSRSLQGKVKKATELIDEVESLKGKAEAKKSCCHGVCPNWLCRYIVGKKAAKKTEAMKQLNDELGQKLPRALRSSLQAKHLPENFIPFQSTTKALDEILKALKDDKNIRIGLHGTGGCGKSYLLKAIHKEVEDVKFKLYKIAFVEVTNPPDVQDIQNSIAIWIGLKLKREKTVGDRGATLSQAFKQDKKYLIILDNVWQVLKFEEIGIPVGENCKVLLSTRQRQIFDYMQFDSVIDLSLLTKDEAWQLFQTHAGEIKEPFLQVAQEIRDECYGLPVAIKAVASFLRVKKELDEWTDVRDTLKDHTKRLDIEEGMEDHYRCLKRSFDELKDAQEVSLFLLCALFPNDSEIAIELLIRFAFGLGIFLDVNSYRTARSKVRKAIGKFKNYCLLLQEGQHVKLHDMFHALALWEAKKKTQVVMGPEQIVDLTNQVYMRDTDRLYCHGIEEFSDQLNCPELDILVVSNNDGYSSKFPDMFFNKMMNLKVLAIKNTSAGTQPDLVIPPSIEGLKKLRTLCLRGWALIRISMFEKLEMLDTIELLDCVMEELPKKLANMKALKLLQVSNCKLGGDPYKVLATCSHLEELYFVDNDLPEMAQLIGQNVVDFFHQIGSFKLLQRYHLGIGGSITTTKDHSSSKLISINNRDASSIKNKALQKLSQTLEVLLLEKIRGHCKSIIPDMLPIQGECLKELKELVLHDSDCIKYLIDTTNYQHDQSGFLFAKLQKLKVEAMKFLKALCHGPPPSGFFDNLKELFITKCSQLSYLFTTTAARKMVVLEVLEVIECDNLRYMIEVDNNDEDISVRSVLPKLKQISVKRCKNLKCVLPISVANGLLHLETLEVEDAAELHYVFGYDNNEKDQNQKQIRIDLSAVKLKLINLPIISSICPQYNDMKLRLDKPVVKECPGLSGIFDSDSEVEQEDGEEDMEKAELLSILSDKDLRFNTWVRTTKDLVQATARQARYFYRFNTFVTDLRKEKDLLMSKLEGIPIPQQQVPVEEAMDLIEEVKMLERKAEESKSCCNWLGRYIVGKRAERMTETVKQFNERLPVTLPPVSSQPIKITGRNNVRMFESRQEPYNKILAALEDDEICIVGLYGMGGCGKTSLILEVCEEVKSLELFDMVASVTVSQYPDIRNIQGTIADRMDMRFEEESVIERAAKLCVKLSNGDKFLIILDDIRQVLKLEDVGIPLGKNCKVVLITRHQHLCTMMGCQKMVYLSPLPVDEALILFQEHAGEIQDPLRDLALEILRECQGLPLAIVAVANALRGRPKEDWMHSIKRSTNHPRGGLRMDAMEQVHLAVHEEEEEDMDRREEQHKEVESAILEDDSNVYGQKSFKSCQEIKELDEADVDSLSPTVASSSSEVVAIHPNKEVPSHTGLTHSNEDRGKENQRGNNDIPRGSIAADLLCEVQGAEKVHPHTQERLQKQKFCPVDSMNLQESGTKIGKGSLHKDTGPVESKVGTSTQELIDKQPEVEIDVNVAKVQDATEVHPQSKEFDVIADTQEGLQQQNSCTFGATNSTEVLIEKQPQIVLDPQQALQEYKASLPLPGQSTMTSPSSTSITNTSPTSDAQISSSKHQHQIAEDEELVKATGSHIHLMKQDGTSDPHQGMLPEDSNNEVQGDFEFQPHSQNFDAVVDIQEQHLQAVGSMNSRESTTEILKGSHHKDPASEESTIGSSSQDKLEGSQMIVDPQQVLQENKVSLPLPVDPTVFSPSTSITTTSSSSTNQPPRSEEFVDFPSLFKIKETRAHLLEEAFVKYPHLWQWKLTQKTLRICKVGYKSLADMLAFLKSETPKTMNDSKMEEFENLYYEVEYFGFDKMWLASIRQRVMDMQADHNNKLKQLDHLKSQIGNLEEQLSDATATLASVKDDLSKPGHVFGF